MDYGIKQIIILKKTTPNTSICIKQEEITLDEDCYYALEGKRINIRNIIGQENYKRLNVWIVNGALFHLALQGFDVICIENQKIKKVFRSIEEFTAQINGFIYQKKPFVTSEILINEEKTLEIWHNVKEERLLLPPISNIVSEINESIIGQEEAVKKTVYAIYSNLNLINKNLSLSEIIALKNNVLLCGPSGTGKTELARQLSQTLSIPVIIEDINQYSGTGWKGADTIELLKKIYYTCHKNIKLAEHSILFLDEIDKIAVKNDDHTHNTLEVQQELLKIIEGGIFTFKEGFDETITFDTKYLSVILAGAFQLKKNTFKEFQKKDFIDYGLIPELVGRIKTFINIKPLTKEQEKKFLLESKLSLLKLEKRELERMGITVNITCDEEKLCEKIIEKSSLLTDNECGLRDYNQISSDLFSEIKYALFDHNTFDKVSFGLDIVEDPSNIILEKTK